MAGAKDHSTLMKRILFGVAGVVLGGSMLLYLSLIPGIVSAIDYVRAFYTLDTGEGRG